MLGHGRILQPDIDTTTANAAMVAAYWIVGKRLFDAQTATGSIYGKQLVKYASMQLQEEFGKGFDERNLRNMRQFYEAFPKWNTVCSELSWSHYRLLMRIKKQEKVFDIGKLLTIRRT